MDLHGKKVLFVITKSNWGGAQSYVYTLATKARDSGANVVVALGGSGEPGAPTGLLDERLKNTGIRTVFLTSFARDIDLAREFSGFKELLGILRTEKPHVLHLNSSKAGGLGALAGRLASVPRIIFTVHGWPHMEPRAPLSRALIWLASWATVNLSHTVIVLSKQQRRGAPFAFSSSKFAVIENGIGNFPMFLKKEAVAALASHEPRIAAFTQLMLSTSELHPNKGLDILLAAFARVAGHHPRAALILMHGGEARDALLASARELGIENRVFFLGFVPEARSFLRAADIFVLPSRKEGLPFGLLEAGRAGVPVIASSVGAIPEVIENGVTGILVPPGNMFALAEALDRLLADPRRGKELGKALHDRIDREYSEQAMVKKTLELY